MAEDFIQVNVPASLGKKLKTWTSLEGLTEVHSEAVTLTDAAGNEVLPATEPTLTALATFLNIMLDVALSTRLADATFTSRINTLGQKPMAGSTPVVVANDQAAIPAAPPITTGILTVVPASLVSGSLLAANSVRIGFSIMNKSDIGYLYLLANTAGGPASLTNYTVAIPPGGYYEDPFRYAGEVIGIWDALVAGDLAMVNEYRPV